MSLNTCTKDFKRGKQSSGVKKENWRISHQNPQIYLNQFKKKIRVNYTHDIDNNILRR